MSCIYAVGRGRKILCWSTVSTRRSAVRWQYSEGCTRNFVMCACTGLTWILYWLHLTSTDFWISWTMRCITRRRHWRRWQGYAISWREHGIIRQGNRLISDACQGRTEAILTLSYTDISILSLVMPLGCGLPMAVHTDVHSATGTGWIWDS